MQLVGADWLRSDRREDNLGGRPGSIVQVWLGFLVTQVSRKLWFETIYVCTYKSTSYE